MLFGHQQIHGSDDTTVWNRILEPKHKYKRWHYPCASRRPGIAEKQALRCELVQAEFYIWDSSRLC